MENTNAKNGIVTNEAESPIEKQEPKMYPSVEEHNTIKWIFARELR
jgi:hypothetical protein